MMLEPITRGWEWGPMEWWFNPESNDTRDPAERTKEEVVKSLNDVWTFLKFTT